MKIRHGCLGLLLVATAWAGGSNRLNAQSTLVESTGSQCQRFEAAMTRFNDRFTSSEHNLDSQYAIAESLFAVLNTELQPLASQQFSDSKIQALHHQSLGIILVAQHNMANYLSATDQGEPAKAEIAYGNLQFMPYQLSDVVIQFEQYCDNPPMNNNL
jgi:hypothetical protein